MSVLSDNSLEVSINSVKSNSINNSKSQNFSPNTSQKVESLEVVQLINNTYQPNFVLKNSSNLLVVASGSGLVIFGDIIPLYKSQNQLVEIIVLSRESLVNFLLTSRTVFICLISLFSQFINSLAYQTYILIGQLYELVIGLPTNYYSLVKEIQFLMEILNDVKSRELWWLSFKIELRISVNKFIKKLQKVLYFTQKFYLTGLISVTLLLLYVVGQFNLQPNNTVESSSLSKFILDRTVITQQFTQINANTKTNPDDLNLISTQNKETRNDTTTNSKVVFEYTVKEGETIVQIAALYGLKEEIVKFNNNLENQEIKPGTQLILPWTDAYIYKAEDEVTINYLSQLYQIDGQEILDYNQQQWSQEDKIPKSTLILIPTNDLEKIKLINQQEEERKENLRKAEEERKKRAALAYYGNGNTYRGVTSDQARSEGLIWPVAGNFIISRCVQPGHIACDFADPSSPPIFAAKDGVVSAVYRFNVVGYGLAVVIDHGNGLKTLYAHLSEIYVKPGEFVKQGVAIGRMGCTGWCTGTHLHFEVIYNGVRQDPLLYLS